MNPAEREAQETCLELIRTLENVHRCYHVAWTINEHIESVNEEHKRFFLLAFEALIERSAMSICKAFDRQKNSASVPNVLIILQKQAVWPSVWMRIVGWPTNTAKDKFEFAQNEAKRIVTEIEGEADNVRPFLKDFKNFRNREVAHVQP